MVQITSYIYAHISCNLLGDKQQIVRVSKIGKLEKGQAYHVQTFGRGELSADLAE